MKAALLLSPGKIELQDIAPPSIGADDVLIEPAYAGICGTDISFYLGHRTVPYPFVLGHELTGHVTGLGSAVTKLHVGQRIVVEPNYPCGRCALCAKGRGAICAMKGSMGVNLPGCFSEQVLAPAEFVWPVPNTVSDQDAATLEPLTVSLHGLLQSGAQKEDAIAVLGCGVVGLLLIHAAVAMGIRVIAHDRLTDKLEMARDLGAAIVSECDDVTPIWQKENVATIFECAGAPSTVELALQAAPRGAQVLLLGLSSTPASFTPMRLVREGIQIQTSMIYDHPADFARAIDLVARGVLHPARIVTHTYSFDSIHQALDFSSTGKAGKIHVKMI
jgi:L-iditol 2-dehydrogenase